MLYIKINYFLKNKLYKYKLILVYIYYNMLKKLDNLLKNKLNNNILYHKNKYLIFLPFGLNNKKIYLYYMQEHNKD